MSQWKVRYIDLIPGGTKVLPANTPTAIPTDGNGFCIGGHLLLGLLLTLDVGPTATAVGMGINFENPSGNLIAVVDENGFLPGITGQSTTLNSGLTADYDGYIGLGGRIDDYGFQERGTLLPSPTTLTFLSFTGASSITRLKAVMAESFS